MNRFLILCSILLTSFLAASCPVEKPPFAFFQPPKGWLISDPTNFEDGVKIGFVQSKRKIFTPAMSLAIEKVSCDQKTYVEAVKKIQLSDMTKNVSELGLIETKSGKAHLLQIETKNSWGKVHILQAILIKDGYAYIQTTSCLSEDFLKLHETFLNSLNSLSITSSPFAIIEQDEDLDKKIHDLKTCWKKHLKTTREIKEDLFKGNFFQKNQWIPFTEYLTKHYTNLGICWQILVIQHIKDELMNL